MTQLIEQVNDKWDGVGVAYGDLIQGFAVDAQAKLPSCFFWDSIGAPNSAFEGLMNPASNCTFSCFMSSANSSGAIL